MINFIENPLALNEIRIAFVLENEKE